MNNTNIWNLLQFDKGDIFFYLVSGVILMYIWKDSNISINYWFPFVLLCIIIYLRQDWLHRIDLQQDHKLKDIKNQILANKYNMIEEKLEILYFLDSIKIYKKYNNKTFEILLNGLNKYYIQSDVSNLKYCMDVYDSMIYSLPQELANDHYIKKNELLTILKLNLKNHIDPILESNIHDQMYITHRY